MRLLLTLALFITIPFAGNAEDKPKKVHKLNFDETDVDGKIRQPDGSYIVQKRGVDFVPLYKLRKSFDQRIEQSIEHLR